MASATRRILRTLAILAAFVSTACVSTGYRASGKSTPPPERLDVSFGAGRLEATLVSVIAYNGPGSWKRNACWDEYVVTVRNTGNEPLTIAGATLKDSEGAVRAPGVAPWSVEKESRRLEKRYRAAGIAFVRYTAPGLMIVGTGAATIASAGIFSSAAATAAAATVVALPVYYISVLAINHRNKGGMERQFQARRMGLPMTLAPGESKTGSFFFPMVPSPHSLSLQWSDPSGGREAVLALDFLHHLHVRT